jgi:ABC-2 type transport system ATP-binding protein
MAAALTADPALLLLDEPTNGLDPLAVRWLREVLLDLKKGGKAILISSHHLDELQRLADVLIFVRSGRSTGSWSRSQALRDFPSLEALFEFQISGEEP